MTECRADFAGVILAGGASARMGGVDKALIMFRGRPLLSSAVALLAPQVAQLGLSVHRPDVAFAPYGLELVIDAPGPGAERQGPMSGIAASLAWAAGLDGIAWCMTMPVDCPLLPGDLAVRLHQAAVAGGAPAAYVKTPAGEEPLAAIWSIACAVQAVRFLEAGGRSVRTFHREIGSAALPGDALWATNLNAMGDIAAAEARPSDV
jgi:molybdopterin-guanine dinucleotide biosynthesis protein A